jgi:uncharacterized protein YaaR (DUF327 family)
MKTISIVRDYSSIKGFAFVLSNDVTTKEFINFKRTYKDFLEPAIDSVLRIGLNKTFLLKNILELWDLKLFMKNVKNINEWNLRREKAKKYFSGQSINDLDASGFVNEILQLKK